jgi:hypothetical protein
MPPRKPTARTMASQVVPNLVRLLGDAGLAVAKRFGLPQNIAELVEVVVPLSKLDAICDALAQASGDPLLPFRVGGMVQRGTYGLIELTARAAPTLDVAMGRFARYTPLLNDQIWSSGSAHRPAAGCAIPFPACPRPPAGTATSSTWRWCRRW